MNSAEMSIRRLPRLSDIRKSKQTFAAKDINVCNADKAALRGNLINDCFSPIPKAVDMAPRGEGIGLSVVI